jgi:hypothetical protein
MVQSGEWRPWPSTDELFRATGSWQHFYPEEHAPTLGWDVPAEPVSFDMAQHLNDLNLDLALSGEPIAVPKLIIEDPDSGRDRLFLDGPYVVEIDVTASDLSTRQRRIDGARAFVPLWRVKAVLPPPYGITQGGYDMVVAGPHGEEGLQGFMDTVYLEDLAAYTDGVQVRESPGDQAWAVGSGGFLCTPRAMELM